jgi:subtilisin family serine protease
MDAFPACTGRGIRIAVIDSGVNTAHPHIGRVAGGVNIATMAEDFTDVLGHGTAVMAAIMEKAPDAEYFAVKVFQTSLRASAEQIATAIEWCIDQDMHVINLSLGTANESHAARFAPLIQRGAQHGVILVAAADALPGSLPGVIEAHLDWECPRESYKCIETGFYTSGYPRSIPGVPRERNLNGMSFAVANLTGFVACACEGKERSYDRICGALTAQTSELTDERVRAQSR